MASKNHKNKPCAYCGGESASKDHVIARTFFTVKHRSNIPIVPSCMKCNNKKSSLKNYISTIFLMARHGDPDPEGSVNEFMRRLDKNKKLARQILPKMKLTLFPTPSGMQAPLPTMPFDGEKYENLLLYIIKGLTYHHFGIGCYGAVDAIVSFHGMDKNKLYAPLGLPDRATIERILGDGQFTYRTYQAPAVPELILWDLNMFYGPKLYADTRPTHNVLAVTGAYDFIERNRQRYGGTRVPQ
jgi:hypothetical protein